MQNYFHKGDILSLSQIIVCTEKMIESQGGGANELAQLLESQNSLIKKYLLSMSRLDTFHSELNKMEIMLSLKRIEITTMLDFEVSIDKKNMLELC